MPSSLFPTTKVAQTNSLSTEGTFEKIMIRFDYTSYENKDMVVVEATADGSTYEEVATITNSGEFAMLYTFLTTGSDLRLRFTFYATGGTDTYIENLTITGVTNHFRLSFGTFNGTDNYINISHDSDFSFSDDMSIAIAVKVPTLPGAEVYLLNKYDGTDGYAVRINASNEVELYYADSGAGTTFSTGTALTADTWQHVVFTKSGTALKSYVNGVAADTATGGATIGTNSNALEVGRYSSSYFSGALDEVRLYSDELTAAEALALSVKKEHLSSCVLYWSMDNPKFGDRFTTKIPV